MSAPLVHALELVAVGDGAWDGRTVGRATRKAVLSALAWRAHDDGTIPPHRTILADLADALELTPSSLWRVLRSLVADGWVAYEPGPSRRPGAYAVVVDRLWTAADAAADGARPGRAPTAADGARPGRARCAPDGNTVRALGANGARPGRAVLDIDVNLAGARGREADASDLDLTDRTPWEAGADRIATVRAALRRPSATNAGRSSPSAQVRDSPETRRPGQDVSTLAGALLVGTSS